MSNNKKMILNLLCAISLGGVATVASAMEPVARKKYTEKQLPFQPGSKTEIKNQQRTKDYGKKAKFLVNTHATDQAGKARAGVVAHSIEGASSSPLSIAPTRRELRERNKAPIKTENVKQYDISEKVNSLDLNKELGFEESTRSSESSLNILGAYDNAQEIDFETYVTVSGTSLESPAASQKPSITIASAPKLPKPTKNPSKVKESAPSGNILSYAQRHPKPENTSKVRMSDTGIPATRDGDSTAQRHYGRKEGLKGNKEHSEGLLFGRTEKDIDELACRYTDKK